MCLVREIQTSNKKYVFKRCQFFIYLFMPNYMVGPVRTTTLNPNVDIIRSKHDYSKRNNDST